jgi:hypothetical protein
LGGVVRFLAQQSPEAAERIGHALLDAIHPLRFPHLHKFRLEHFK